MIDGKGVSRRTTALLVIVLVLIDSLYFVFARLLLPRIAPAVSAFYVLAIGAVEVTTLGLIQKRLRLKVFLENWPLFLGIGLLISLSMSINYRAVAFIDPGAASLLSKTSILFGLIFSLVWLKEPLAPVQGLGALLAFGGVLAITFQPGDYLRLGSLLILASAFMYALHAALVKRYGEQIDLLNFFAFRLLSTSAFLFAFLLISGDWAWPTWDIWPLLLLVGTLDIAISRLLYYAVLRRVTMGLHTIMLTLSPALSVGWSWLIFQIAPSWQEMLGGAAVMAGVVIVTRNRPKPAATVNN
jgi:drug/metabolite transporter (DMT)-like permease